VRTRLQRLRIVIVGILTIVSTVGMQASAGVKVVIAFDANGQRLSQMVRSGPAPKRLVGKSQRQMLRQRAASFEVPPGQASLRWLDSAGQVLEVAHVADPRIAHFPGSTGRGIALQPGGRVVLEAGALLVDGPDKAVELVVDLPGVEVPLLSSETWQFNLIEYSVNNQD